MKTFRQGYNSLKEQYGEFYQKKFKQERTYKLITIIIWATFMFCLGYWIGL